MPWFFVSCVVGVIVCLVLDRRAHAYLYRSGRFHVFQLMVGLMTVAFDMVARGRVWHVNAESVTGVAVAGTPIELILFGYVMIYVVVIAYEYLRARTAVEE